MDSKRLGEWLRKGLRNSAWDSERARDWKERLRSAGDSSPVGVCLSQDNPKALAALMSAPERFSALAAMEPKPMGKPPLRGAAAACGRWGPPESMRKAALEGEAGFESSLLWHAVAAGAYRCAGLLAAIPEFAKPAMLMEGFSSGDESCHWMSRANHEVFVEEQNVEFSFFEWMACARKESAGGSRAEERLQASWQAMVESAIDHASPEAKAWVQEGTGMGWPEIYFARAGAHRWGRTYDRGDNEYAQRDVGAAMATLDRFERAGFPVDWKALAEVSSESKAFSEWLELRSASAGAPSAGKRRSPSL